jgi:hypothetical protein
MRSEPLALAALKGAAVIAALVVLVDGLLGCLTILGQFDDIRTGLLIALPVLVTIALGAWLVLRAPDERRARHVAIGILAFSLVSRVVWVSVFDAYQTDDWGRYLRGAVDALATGHPEWSPFCRGVFWTRIVANTLLPVWLFGPSLWAVKGINVLATTLTSWLWFETGVTVVGARVAALSLLFLAWQPDLWYAVNLASHDVMGMLWLTLALFLAARLWRACTRAGAARPRRSALALSVALGLTIAVAGWSRGFDAALLVALGGGALVEGARRLRVREDGLGDGLRSAGTPAGLLFALPLLVWLVANQLFWLHTRERDALSLDVACVASTIDVQGSSRWHETVGWWRDQCPRLPPEQHWRFPARKVLHEMTSDPAAYVRYLQRKNRIFALVGDYVQWAGAVAPDPGDPTAGQVRWIDALWINQQSCAATAGEVVLLLLVLGRVLLYPRVSIRPAAWPTLAFSACLYALLLALLEAQGRYDLFLILPFSWMAGELLSSTTARTRAELPPPAPTGRARLYALGTAALAGLLVGYWSAARLLADGPLTLRDQRGFAESRGALPLPELDQSPRVLPRLYLDSSKRLALGYPSGASVPAGSVVAVERTFAVAARPRHHLRFFLSTSDARGYPWQEGSGWRNGDFELVVAANERVLWHGTLDQLGDDLYVSLEAPPGSSFEPQVRLRLVLLNRVGIGWVDEDAPPVVLLEYIDLQ